MHSSGRVQQIDVRTYSQAPPDKVWGLLADVATWTAWGPWQEAGLVRPGNPEPDGVGAVRRLRRGRTVVIEEIVCFEPGRRLAYELRSGLRLRNYRAEVALSRLAAGGTRIHWTASFSGMFPGQGLLMRVVLGRFIQEVADRLAKRAESHLAPAASRGPAEAQTDERPTTVQTVYPSLDQ